jgi:hypothetical protein
LILFPCTPTTHCPIISVDEEGEYEEELPVEEE